MEHYINGSLVSQEYEPRPGRDVFLYPVCPVGAVPKSLGRRCAFLVIAAVVGLSEVLAVGRGRSGRDARGDSGGREGGDDFGNHGRGMPY